ncbi:uncharacterized protein LOC123700378 [Colias croceus]|uniref:uncharacterized protein LOC123700378 n=1 Tax=Colias crocea TaxID=72248 RepID=UPI001E27FB82|nr:uncharacterized protein LOC123700378 [Colias croceus]
MSNRVVLERSMRRALWLSRALGAAPLHLGDRMRPSRAFACYGKLFFAAVSVPFAYEVYSLACTLSQAGTPSPAMYRQSGRLALMLLELLALGAAALRGQDRARLNKIEMETCLLDRTLQLIVPAIVLLVGLIATSHFYFLHWTLSISLLAFLFRTASCLLMMQFVLLALLINCALRDVNKRLELLAVSATESAAISYKSLARPRYVVPIQYINVSLDAIGSLSKISNDANSGKCKSESEWCGVARSYVRCCRLVHSLNAEESFRLFLHVTSLAYYLAVCFLHLFGKYNVGTSLWKWLVNLMEQSVSTLFNLSMLLLLVEPAHRMDTELQRTQWLVSAAGQVAGRGGARLAALLRARAPRYEPAAVCTLARPLLSTLFLIGQ